MMLKRLICLFRKHKYSTKPFDRIYIGKLHPESMCAQYPPRAFIKVVAEFILQGEVFLKCTRCGHLQPYGHFIHFGDNRASPLPMEFSTAYLREMAISHEITEETTLEEAMNL